MRPLSKLAVAVLALVFVGATVINSNAFADSTAKPSDASAVMTPGAAHEPLAVTAPVAPSVAAQPEVQPTGVPLALAVLACVVFLAGRRARR